MVFTLRAPVTLTFDLLTQKSIGFFYSIRAITIFSLNGLEQALLQLLTGYGFHSSGPLWPWPLTPKSIGVLYSIRTSIVWSLNALGQTLLEILSGNGFHCSGPCDLDLLTPKSIGFFYSIRAITLWSLNALGQTVLLLLSVTDGQGKNNMSPTEGGGGETKSIIIEHP
jgi:hypothetical protein